MSVLDVRQTEQPNPAAAELDRLSAEEMLRVMNDQDAQVPAVVRTRIPEIAKAVEAIAAAMRNGGRLFFAGAGTSGRLGVLESTECPPTFGVSPGQVQAIMAGGERALFQVNDMAEDDAGTGAADVLNRGVTASDVLVGVSASGESAYVLGAVGAARRMHALTVGVSCNDPAALNSAVDIAITPLTGPEVVAGSTRLKAATATKLVLNMLTTGAMVQLGHVYRNLMVNVQPTNRKLKLRAARIVGQVLGVESDAAAVLLEAAGGSAKTAIVMGRLTLSREEAERRLRNSAGHVSEVLGERRW